jgi:hypothetical protein
MESRTRKATKLAKARNRNSEFIPYQNLGPLPDDAMYQVGSVRFTVKIIRNQNNIPLYPPKWLLINEHGNTMLTPSLYRAWIDHIITMGADQIIELPWSRKQIHVRMEAQDYQGRISAEFGAEAQTRLEHIPPLAVYSESLG